jgi:hypothetical protein
MAVFVAAGDERDGAAGRGAFVYGGFVAPVDDWVNWFAPAWEERVLNGPPTIPYMHMTEIRSRDWRERHGLTLHEAERRVDEATRVICSMGSLHFVKSEMDGGHFRDVLGDMRIIRPGKQPGVYPMQPDYTGFYGFVYAALEYVHTNYPDAEKVDFIVERKSGITPHLDDFYRSIDKGLRAKGEGHLIRLIGELIPGGKDRVPLQAADVGIWHFARHAAGQTDITDGRRAWRMFHNQRVTVNGLTNEQITAIGVKSKARKVRSPFKTKKRVRDGAA